MKRIAEALVECGYAHSVPTSFNFIPQDGIEYVQMVKKPDPFRYGQYQEVNPFANTLEGRRQADALEDWLVHEQTRLWMQSSNTRVVPENNKSKHQDRLDRIKWCFSQLEAQK